MILPQGAVVAVVDGEKLVMFHNTGHATEVELKAMDAPEVEPGTPRAGITPAAPTPTTTPRPRTPSPAGSRRC